VRIDGALVVMVWMFPLVRLLRIEAGIPNMNLATNQPANRFPLVRLLRIEAGVYPAVEALGVDTNRVSISSTSTDRSGGFYVDSGLTYTGAVSISSTSTDRSGVSPLKALARAESSPNLRRGSFLRHLPNRKCL
jgi:hypothetical protein